MKKPLIVMGWLGDPDVAFSNTVRLILEGLKDNPDFLNPQPTFKSVEDAYKAYTPYVVNKEKVSGENAAMRTSTRGALEVLLRELGPWVQLTSGNDLNKLLSTNWPLADMPSSAPDPETPDEIVLYIAGDPISLFVKCKAQTNAKLYTAQVSRDQQNWEWTESDTGSTVEIKGLPVGVTLYLQMRMKNVKGPSNWSSTIKFRIPLADEVVPQRKKIRKKEK